MPPTKAGYYWGQLSDEPLTVIVFIANDLCMFDGGCNNRMALEEVSHWLGPLPEPEPPK